MFLRLMFVWSIAESARILCLFPYPGVSHFLAFKPLLQKLAERGHNLTVLSYFPNELPVQNYEDVSLSGSLSDYNNNVTLDIFEIRPSTLLTNLQQLYNFLNLYEPAMKQSKELMSRQYDLVITEAFNTEMFLGIPYLMGIPFLSVSSCSLLPWTNYYFGNPVHPAYIPNTFLPHDDKMNFFERLSNFVAHHMCLFSYYLFFETYSQKLAEEHLGPLPPLASIAKNTSLILVNSHFSFHKVRPLVPAVIEVGGIHIAPPQRLSQELQELLKNSSNGVIYFSVGSLLRGATFPKWKKNIFLNIFSKLNQTVLWKWEEEMQNKPDNVYISNWFPQNDILGYPNVVLFICHGGLLGITEAAYHGVPILGIPMYGDQELNVKAMVSAKAGIKVSFQAITESNIQSAVNEILQNPEYKKNAELLSRRFKDRPMSAMDTGIFWVEYVIRHKGAPHLQSETANLTWYQYYMLDILLVIALSVMMIILLMYSVVTCTYRIFSVKSKIKVS